MNILKSRGLGGLYPLTLCLPARAGVWGQRPHDEKIIRVADSFFWQAERAAPEARGRRSRPVGMERSETRSGPAPERSAGRAKVIKGYKRLSSG